jgi:hypothetical protein
MVSSLDVNSITSSAQSPHDADLLRQAQHIANIPPFHDLSMQDDLAEAPAAVGSEAHDVLCGGS